MLNYDKFSKKLKDYLNKISRDCYDCDEINGTCGMVILYELGQFMGTQKKEYEHLVGALRGYSHVVFTDRLDREKTVFRYAKAIAQKGVIGINPNSDAKIRTYTVTWDILLKAMKINPRDKKWK